MTLARTRSRNVTSRPRTCRQTLIAWSFPAALSSRKGSGFLIISQALRWTALAIWGWSREEPFMDRRRSWQAETVLSVEVLFADTSWHSKDTRDSRQSMQVSVSFMVLLPGTAYNKNK